MKSIKPIKPIVINLFAGPGCGKSTTAASIFALLKLHGVNAELVTEFAKDLTWENRKYTLENQLYILAKQYHRMWRLKDQVTVTITDSPILLSLIYGGQKPGYIQKTILHYFNEFNNVNYFLKRNKKYNPNGRNQTEYEARQLDSIILKTLLKLGISSQVYLDSYKTINAITRSTLEYIGISVHTTLISGKND
jgi:hypothetical protein